MKSLRSFALLSTSFLFSCLSYAQDDEAAEPEAGPLSAETFAGMELRGIGPALMSGRIADVAHPPGRPFHLVRRSGQRRTCLEDRELGHDLAVDLRWAGLLLDRLS